MFFPYLNITCVHVIYLRTFNIGSKPANCTGKWSKTESKAYHWYTVNKGINPLAGNIIVFLNSSSDYMTIT